MRRKTPALLAVIAVLAGGALAAGAVVGFEDERRSGEVTEVKTYPDGSTEIYRSQPDGDVIIEHRDADGEVWFESNGVLGRDGEPIICSNGEPLRVDFDEARRAPDPQELARAQRNVPPGKAIAFNQYTGRFQQVDAMQVDVGGGRTIVAQEAMVYKCTADNRPTLAPLSEVDPEAAKEARQAFERQVASGAAELSGLGEDPAAASP